jgi:serine protease Do
MDTTGFIMLITLRRSGGVSLVLLLLMLQPVFAAEPAVPQSMQQVQLTFAPVVRSAAPAVVNIFTRQPDPAGPAPLKNTPAYRRYIAEDQQTQQNPLGSGVLVSPDGEIVTNEHVIHDAGSVTIVLNDRREFDAATIRTDERTDLALLKIDPGSERLPYLEIGDSDKLSVGDIVLAIGNPFGVGQTVTFGIVSALARTVNSETDERTFIQTDAAINPGNSGGALVSLDGKLVGINTALYSEGGGSVGIGFAIPTALVRGVIAATGASQHVVRPWLGVTGTEVTVRMARRLGLGRVSGVYVENVKSNSPLALAGIMPGDVIEALNGAEIDDPEALRFRIDTQQIGSQITLQVWHEGVLRDVSVKLMPPPEEPHRDVTQIAGSLLAGVTVANLSPALAEELQVNETAGVIVLNVPRNSPAARLPLSVGDIITSIGGQPILTVAALEQVLTTAPGTVKLSIERGGRQVQIAFAP